MKRSYSLAAIVACLAFLATVAVAFPGSADSAVKRLAPSTFCHPEFSIRTIFGNTAVDVVRRIGSQLRVQFGTSTLTCGFPSDNAILHNQVDQVKVRGFRGGVGDFLDAGVRACVGNFVGTQHCGLRTDFGDGGNFSVVVDDLSEWGNSFWYPYLSVEMQTGDRLYGIVASN